MMQKRVLIKIELYVSAPDNGAPLQHLGHRDVIVEKIHEGELPDGEIGDYTVVEATPTLLQLTPVSDDECYKKASAELRKRNAERNNP